MKRQHPTDPNLFWCPKCGTYKVREEFGKNTKLFHGIRGHCKCCCNQSEKNRKKDRERINKQRRDWRKRTGEYASHMNYYRAAAIKNNTKRMLQNPEREKLIKNNNSKKRRDNLRDSYVAHCCRVSFPNPSPETIELKRQQIIMKRTLKQLKEWRKEHESDRDVISGEQRENETVNEVN